MTQETVAIHFTYVVGGETKEGSTEVRARVEDVESKEGWERAARRCVFEAICEAEPELILKTPNGWFGNTQGHKDPETEFIGPLNLDIPGFSLDSGDEQAYTLHRRLDKPRKLDLP
ncbi:hypothetical protein [Stutzerimonas stutzeri]|uniref:hypothetical protein n=1 Tax=Stutzerimonas stutzeri TaxID=316 RepID=UPI001C4C212E|nr:hypothetical protein [Stutzerimonas stutzeri]QXP26330.1 hypothetical protein KVH38_03275 [Stutzerimonas stutzeri]